MSSFSLGIVKLGSVPSQIVLFEETTSYRLETRQLVYTKEEYNVKSKIRCYQIILIVIFFRTLN